MSSSGVNDGNLNEHFQQTSQTPITAFLAKLWALVNDPTCDDLISWDSSGGSFHVYDQSRFAREVLPRYFKHNNFASFIRQLNMYGFRKISSIEQGSLKSERDDIEFAHPSFIRGQETLLEFIKRRATETQQKVNVQPIKSEPTRINSSTVESNSSPTVENKNVRAIEFGNLLEDVRTLKNKQTSVTDKLSFLEDENQALWREISSLRQKHSKQQQIVTKLMEFLLHILNASTQGRRRPVEQNCSNQSEQRSTSNSTIVTSHSLKRKPAALMLSEEPSKRINRQTESIGVNPNSLFIDLTSNNQTEPRITINEINDADLSRWLPTNDESPLVDLVPSPPPTITPIGFSSSNQQTSQILPSADKFNWIDSNDNLPFSLSNNVEQNQTFLPDFFLTSDQDQQDLLDKNGQIIDDINTIYRYLFSRSCNTISQKSLVAPLKDEIVDQSNTTDNNSIHQSGSLGFSLDEFSGHVENIQESLDNIREFMFNKLPDDNVIDDLFNDDHVLLSPLLQPGTNLLNEDISEEKNDNVFAYLPSNSNKTEIVQPLTSASTHSGMIIGDNKIKRIEPISASNTDSDQLLKQLIHQNRTIEQQQQTRIKQLESEKSKLEARLNILDRQAKK